jgi:hypothetical protein
MKKSKKVQLAMKQYRHSTFSHVELYLTDANLSRAKSNWSLPIDKPRIIE